MAKKPKDETQEFEIVIGTTIDGELKHKGARVQLDPKAAADLLALRRIRPAGYDRRDMNPKE